MHARTRARISAVSGTLLVIALGAWAAARTTGSPAWSALQDGALVIAAIIAGAPIARSALAALRHRAFSIDLLVTIAVSGALIIGEFVEAGVVAFLFVFGSWLEARTLERTRGAIRDMVDMEPRTAEVLRDGATVTVPVDQVGVGEHVVVRTGSQIPVDGDVVSGSGHVDESAITGEPVPARKDLGDSAFSGTSLTDGFLTVRAQRVGADTTFSRIIELVEDAQDSASSTQRFLDRFAAWYTPAIIVSAVIVLLLTRDLHFALTFLVIACPGALVISTPVSMVAGIGNGARHGVLLKGGDAVERLAAVDTLVVDKTGTLTHGRPELTVVRAVDGDDTGMLALAAGLEQASEHPLGRAVVEAATARGLVLAEPADVTVHAGSGISGLVDGERVAVGSPRLLADLGAGLEPALAEQAAELERGGATVFFVARGPRGSAAVLGMIAVADTVRPEAASLRTVHHLGIDRVVMLTGDNARTAGAVGEALGIDEVRAELLPEQKVDAVRELTATGRRVAMIGDGINDAPAIASAHVGIAMGTGSDASIDAADVVLVGSRFDQLLHARRLARATVANVRQNTAIALVTVIGLLLGVLGGAVFMSLGMLIHEGSVLLVVLNAMRLIRFRTESADMSTSRRGPDAAEHGGEPAELPVKEGAMTT